MGLRPEHISLGGALGATLGNGSAGRAFEATVEVVEQLGSEIILETRVGDTRITVARVPAETPIAAGDAVRLTAHPGRMHFFDPTTEEPIIE